MIIKILDIIKGESKIIIYLKSLTNIIINKELIIKNNMGKKNLFKGLKIIKKQSIIFRIFTIILLFASLLAISFNLNFKEEYIKVKLEDTPYNIIDVNSMYLEDFEDYINKTYFKCISFI